MNMHTDPRSCVILFIAALDEGETDTMEAPGTNDRLVAELEADGWTVECHREHEIALQIAVRGFHVLWRYDDLADAAGSGRSWVHIGSGHYECEACEAIDRAYFRAVAP